MNTIKIKDTSDIPDNFTGIVEYPNKNKAWYKEGKLHRENGPAIEEINGSKIWFEEGEHHREDGPACDFSDGNKYWLKEGNYHREDGPAVMWKNGTKYWYLEGIYYEQINIEDYIVLNYYKGEYNILWYKLLDKDRVFECPDIPGLITK